MLPISRCAEFLGSLQALQPTQQGPWSWASEPVVSLMQIMILTHPSLLPPQLIHPNRLLLCMPCLYVARCLILLYSRGSLHQGSSAPADVTMEAELHMHSSQDLVAITAAWRRRSWSPKDIGESNATHCVLL